MTIQTMLKKATIELFTSGSPSSELDARVLIGHVLKNDDTFILMHPDMPLTNYQYSRIRSFIRRRKQGEPIAYITGHKEFYGYDFIVNKNVLVPRPETEWLVEEAVRHIKCHSERSEESSSNAALDPSAMPQDDKKICPDIQYRNFNILDLGTGSGCIIISMAKLLTNSSTHQLINFYGSDISTKALQVAKKNAKRLLFPPLDNGRLGGVNNIHFINSNLFSNRLLHKKFDLVIANLPYVPKLSQKSKANNQKNGVILNLFQDPNTAYSGKMNSNPISFEPQSAIFADNNGTSIIKKFLDQSQKYLTKNGTILIELDPRNALELEKYAQKIYSKAKIELKKDLAGLDRYIIINS